MASYYDSYSVTLSSNIYTLTNTIFHSFVSLADVAPDNDGYLGSSESPAFVYGGNLNYFYVGTITYASTAGVGYGFIGEATTAGVPNGTYELFVVHGSAHPNAATQTITVQPPTGVNETGLWDLNTGAPAALVYYDAYDLTSAGDSLTTTATLAQSSQSMIDNLMDGFVLGSTSDTFGYAGTTYTYDGTVSFTTASGQAEGFVGHDSSMAYRLFVVAGTGAPSPGAQSLFPIAGPDPIGSWDLNLAGPQCFARGTRIATPAGERAVETLRPGDLVLTADGRACPVRWIGRTLVGRVGGDPLRVLPVRISAGALGPGVPVRDLVLSPGHAVLVRGVLAHAAVLIDGETVWREPSVPLAYTMYHVELDRHEILLAEGAPVESFLPTGEDVRFDNWHERPAMPEAPELPYPRVRSPRQMPRALRSARVLSEAA